MQNVSKQNLRAETSKVEVILNDICSAGGTLKKAFEESAIEKMFVTKTISSSEGIFSGVGVVSVAPLFAQASVLGQNQSCLF